jgi:hypothetical protein
MIAGERVAELSRELQVPNALRQLTGGVPAKTTTNKHRARNDVPRLIQLGGRLALRPPRVRCCNKPFPLALGRQPAAPQTAWLPQLPTSEIVGRPAHSSKYKAALR